MNSTTELAADHKTVREWEKQVQKWTRRGGQFVVKTPKGEKIVTLVTLRKGILRRPFLWSMDLGSRQRIPDPSTGEPFFRHSDLKSEVSKSETDKRKLSFSPEPQHHGETPQVATPTEKDVQSRLKLLRQLRRDDRFDVFSNTTRAERRSGITRRPLP